MEIRSGLARHLMVISFIGTLLAGCSGGGGSSNSSSSPAADTEAPTAKINFPTAQALTTADSITVTGSATDAAGNTISSVTVNGVDATPSNGFASWAVSVPLQPGDNTITVATTDDQGNSEANAASITIKNEVALLNPNDIVLDSGRALLVDEVLRAVVAVDLDSNGQRSVLSGDDNGSGNPFTTPSSIALDSTNGRALVGDGSLVIAVDLATGNRNQIADLGAGNEILDIAVDEGNGGRLLLVTLDGVQTVPSAGGTATDFSSASTGSGPVLESPSSIVIDNAGNRALVTDSSDAAVVAVDLVNGDRSTVASTAIGSGTNLETPLGIALSGDGSRALVTDLGSATAAPMIISINLATQARTIVSAGGSAATGSGVDFSFPVAIATDSANNRSLVVDPALAAVLGVDDTNGNRDAVTSAGVGDGVAFNGPFNIEYDASNDRALVTDNASLAIYTVDLDTGARAILSGSGVGAGTDFQSPFNLAIGSDQAFVTDADTNTASVLAVDLGSGNRTVLASDFSANANKSPLGIALDSSNNTLYLSVIEVDSSQAVVGSEVFSLPINGSTATPVTLSGANFTNLVFAQNLIIDSDAGTAFVADTAADKLFAVTLAGGATSSLARLTNTTPVDFVPLQDLALMGGQTVLVDSSLTSVVGIDNSTGARTTISGGSTGNGVALQSPTGVATAGDRNVLLVVDRFSFAIFAVEPSSGDRVIISR